MKDNKKINDGCLKIFQFLKLLYEDKADYNSVVEIFKDKNNEQSINSIQVNLNKYINTLRVFGVKIAKENHKYKLLSSLYSIDFSFDDLKALSLLTSSLDKLPDIEISQNTTDFLEQLAMRMNNEDRKIFNTLTKSFENDFSFYYSDLREQIKVCEQVCKDEYITKILYKKGNEQLECKCIPKEIIYDSKNAYLKVCEYKGKQPIEIPINNILNLIVSPQKAAMVEMNTTVVYKLKNRLAKSYKIKDNEQTDGRNENGELIVINKNEDPDKLLPRLLRYSYDCEIITPKSLREKMKCLINEALSMYEKED